jgi:hypothetical protein
MIAIQPDGFFVFDFLPRLHGFFVLIKFYLHGFNQNHSCYAPKNTVAVHCYCLF